MPTALKLRAFHLDLKWQHYRFDRYLALLDELAGWGYNTVVLEYENMFPYRCCRRAVHRDAWTMPQVRRFVQAARVRKIQIIPLIQCFGHLEFALRLPAYRHLAENPDWPSEPLPLQARCRRPGPCHDRRSPPGPPRVRLHPHRWRRSLVARHLPPLQTERPPHRQKPHLHRLRVPIHRPRPRRRQTPHPLGRHAPVSP